MFDWKEFVTFAETLFSRCQGIEACWRTVGSRAYYGAHHLLRKKLNIRKMHKRLLRHLDRYEPKLADWIEPLLELRLSADYQEKPFSKEDARYALELARRILSHLKTLS